MSWAPRTAPRTAPVAIANEPAAAARRRPFRHAAFTGPVTAARFPRPAEDEQATAETIALMSRLVVEDSQAPIVRQAAYEAIRGISPRNARKEAEAVFHWIKGHVRFTEDRDLALGIAGLDADQAEVLIRPADLLAHMTDPPRGDCDDFSMLAAAMLRALGIHARLVTIAADPTDASRYSHVYVEADTPEGPIALDTSHGPFPAWSAPAVGKTRRWSIDEMLKLAPARLGDLPTWSTDLMKIGATAAADIARIKATPTGYYQQTGKDGTVTYYQQPGAAALSFPSTGASTGFVLGGSALLIVAVIVVLLLVMKK